MPIIALVGCGIFLLALILGLGSVKTVEAPTIGKRLEGLQAAAAEKKTLRDAEQMNKSFIVRVMLPLADKLSKVFSGITPTSALESCRKDISAAGLTGKVSPLQITTLSYMLMIGLPLSYFFLTELKPERSTTDNCILLIALILGYRLPIGYVQGQAKRRQHDIQKALPFTLDLISISVEAGMAFDGAMQIVAEKTTGPLTDELNLTLREIRLGKGRNEALADLGLRVNVDDLKSFLTAVTYISRLGGSLVDVIRIQANAMRIKRRQRAEEKAMKTPVKIMIPLVLFIFPSMFVVILGPAGMQFIENLKHAPV